MKPEQIKKLKEGDQIKYCGPTGKIHCLSFHKKDLRGTQYWDGLFLISIDMLEMQTSEDILGRIEQENARHEQVINILNGYLEKCHDAE